MTQNQNTHKGIKTVDTDVRARLVQYALSIEKFRSLQAKEQEWLFPMLSRGFRNTLEMLDIISERPMSYEEIAAELGISAQTVTQKLNALAAGGLAIDLSQTKAYAPTGRHRTLASEGK